MTLDADGATRTQSGALRVPARMARTGIQEYLTAEGTTRREYRSPDEVFAQDSLDTYTGSPITVHHPPAQRVDAHTWRAYSVGHVHDARQDGDFVAGHLHVADEPTIQRILSRELAELSAGYTTDVIDDRTPEWDVRQTQIRINHVALLPVGQARGGRDLVVRLDSLGDQQLEVSMGVEIRSDVLPAETEEEATPVDSADEEKKDETVGEEPTAEMAALKALVAKLEAENAELKETVRAQSDAAKDAETKADSRLFARLAIVEKAKAMAPQVRMDSSVSDKALMVSVLSSCGEQVRDDATDDYIRGRFDALKKDSSQDAVARMLTAQGTSEKKTHTDTYYDQLQTVWERSRQVGVGGKS